MSDEGRLKTVPNTRSGHVLPYVCILDDVPKVCVAKKMFSHVAMLCVARHQQMEFCLNILV